MRAFSIIVATIAILCGIACISVVSKFREMYEDIGATLPNITTTFLHTSGWIPGGIFFILGAILIILLILDKPKVAGIFAIPTLLFLLLSAVVLPMFLLTPLSQIIRDVELNEKKQKTEQDVAGNPLVAPESEN